MSMGIFDYDDSPRGRHLRATLNTIGELNDVADMLGWLIGRADELRMRAESVANEDVARTISLAVGADGFTGNLRAAKRYTSGARDDLQAWRELL